MPLARFHLLPVLAVALLALTLAGCGNNYGWNQKLSLVVETPQGEVVAETVQSVEVVYTPEWRRLNGFERSYSLRGEAVVTNLGGDRYLFMLLADAMMAERVLPVDRSDTPGYLRRIEQMAGRGPVTIPPDYYPQMVTFTDINDPTTVRRVDPDNLSATFGSGYVLKAITLEITNELVTTGMVERVLRWLGKYPERPILPKVDLHDFSFAAKLRQGQFIRH